MIQIPFSIKTFPFGSLNLATSFCPRVFHHCFTSDPPLKSRRIVEIAALEEYQNFLGEFLPNFLP